MNVCFILLVLPTNIQFCTLQFRYYKSVHTELSYFYGYIYVWIGHNLVPIHEHLGDFKLLQVKNCCSE